MVRAAAITAVILAASSVSAAPQDAEAWPERAWIAIDVPFQTVNDAFAEALVFPDTARKTETARFSADYASTRGALLDVGGAVRVSRRIGVGATLSLLERTASGAFTLTVPSLIAGNPPLSLSGSVPSLERRDIGVHIQALYPFAMGRAARITLSAGPSIYRVSQDLVRSIEFDTLPGLTVLTFDQAVVTRAGKTVVGFNVGADVTWNVARRIGIGTLARYARANVAIDPGSASGVGRSVVFRSGGFHLGAGLRFRL